MVALAAQLRVVPAPSQFRAREVVRRRRDPGGAQAAVVVRDQVDRDRLPVGLVVVDPAERRAPVVERVEVPVLQHRVAAAAHHPPVGGAHRACGSGVSRGLRQHRGREPVRGRDEPAGHPAADEQRQPHERVDQCGRAHPTAREPCLAPQPRPVFPPPRRDIAAPRELFARRSAGTAGGGGTGPRPSAASPSGVSSRRGTSPRPGAGAGCPRSSPTGCTAPRTGSTAVGRNSSPAV